MNDRCLYRNDFSRGVVRMIVDSERVKYNYQKIETLGR